MTQREDELVWLEIARAVNRGDHDGAGDGMKKSLVIGMRTLAGDEFEMAIKRLNPKETI